MSAKGAVVLLDATLPCLWGVHMCLCLTFPLTYTFFFAPLFLFVGCQRIDFSSNPIVLLNLLEKYKKRTK